MKASISLKNLSIGYRSKHQLRTVASAICASLTSSNLTCLIGPNGVGKSTLLRTLAGFQPPLDGEILLSSSSTSAQSAPPTKKLSDFTPTELAREISVVLTSKLDVTQLTVKEVVGIGRSPYTGFWGTLSAEDNGIVSEALQKVGIPQLATRNIQQLSDGERQKVMIAKALAQHTSIIILDEPTAFLDFPSKVETLQMLHRLAHEEHKTILLSTHDVELALQLSDQLWLMEPQHLSIGTPQELAANGSLSRFIERKGIRFDKERLNIEIDSNPI